MLHLGQAALNPAHGHPRAYSARVLLSKPVKWRSCFPINRGSKGARALDDRFLEAADGCIEVVR
jgi:hypothetical protein